MCLVYTYNGVSIARTWYTKQEKVLYKEALMGEKKRPYGTGEDWKISLQTASKKTSVSLLFQQNLFCIWSRTIIFFSNQKKISNNHYQYRTKSKFINIFIYCFVGFYFCFVLFSLTEEKPLHKFPNI